MSNPASGTVGEKTDKHEVALLLVDVINHFDFPGGDQLFANASQIVPCILKLKHRARISGVPVIYANDNFGRWLSNFDQVLKKCIEPSCRGRELVQQLTPEPEDFVILKPMHSAFFHTPLELLLKHLGTARLVLCGLATNSCILLTAHDAYMRGLKISVPADCVAAESEDEHLAALKQMQKVTKADTSNSDHLSF